MRPSWEASRNCCHGPSDYRVCLPCQPQGDAGEAAHRLNDVTAHLPDIVASIQRDHHD